MTALVIILTKTIYHSHYVLANDQLEFLLYDVRNVYNYSAKMSKIFVALFKS